MVPKRPETLGLKFDKRLMPLLGQLHNVGCQRDKAGNRSLHFDQHCLFVLFCLFDSAVHSLGAIKHASELNSVQRRLGCERASLGSLSEAVTIFDPERLLGIIDSLSAQIKPIRQVGDGYLDETLIAVDGTVVRTLNSIVEASFMADKNGESHRDWRLHTHFEVDRHVPIRIDVTPGSNSGKNDVRKPVSSRHRA